jgi:hypothetical protein
MSQWDRGSRDAEVVDLAGRRPVDPTEAILQRLGRRCRGHRSRCVWRWRWAMPCFAIVSVATLTPAVAASVDDDLAGDASTELVHMPSMVLSRLIGVSNLRLQPLGRG